MTLNTKYLVGLWAFKMDNDTLVEESEDDSSTITTSFAPPATIPTLYEPSIGMIDYESNPFSK